MPGNYAHYRFGAELLKSMPADVRRTVNRHRALYDVGLHGPDIFFYYDPTRKTSQAALGSKVHHQTGREFFTRICKRHRLEPSEPARAYLYGLLAHYCLDQVCHPFIHTHTDEGPIGHTELETEFDRYLLDKDGKRPPHTQDCSRHLALSPEQCALAAGFYPGTTAKHVEQSLRNMAGAARMLAAPDGLPRKALKLGIDLAARQFREYYMTAGPNPTCAHLDGELEQLYGLALRLYPELLRQITANLTCSVPLGRDFEPEFG